MIGTVSSACYFVIYDSLERRRDFPYGLQFPERRSNEEEDIFVKPVCVRVIQGIGT
jgi:hypothetical protein